MKKKYFGSAAAFLTMAAMAVGSCPMTADAADGEIVVALGDSITSGYSMDGSLILPYTDMVSGYYGAELINLAENGATTGDLLTKLSDSNVQQTIASADVILVTIGGNDILQPILHSEFVDASQYSSMTELIAAMREKDETDPLFKLSMILYLEQVMPDAISTCNSNITEIAAQLNALNSHAEIVFQTVYNPMDLDADDTPLASNGLMEVLSANVTKYLEGHDDNVIYNVGINDTIRSLQDVTVADAYATLFDRAHYYTGISNVDVHPNSIGHLAIAETILEAMQRSETGSENGTKLRAAYTRSGAEQTLADVNAALNEQILGRVLKNSYGDVDANSSVELADASAVLGLYASTAADAQPSVTGVNALAADSNQDGTVDLTDASLILSYYAGRASGSFSGTFSEYLAQLS